MKQDTVDGFQNIISYYVKVALYLRNNYDIQYNIIVEWCMKNPKCFMFLDVNKTEQKRNLQGKYYKLFSESETKFCTLY